MLKRETKPVCCSYCYLLSSYGQTIVAHFLKTTQISLKHVQIKAKNSKQHKGKDLYKRKRCLQSVDIIPMFILSCFILVTFSQLYIFSSQILGLFYTALTAKRFKQLIRQQPHIKTVFLLEVKKFTASKHFCSASK